MLYSIPQFEKYEFLIDFIPTEQVSSYENDGNVVFLNPKLLLSTSILFSSLYKTAITYKYTNNKFVDTDFIRDIFINLLAVKNVKKVAFDTFTVDDSAEKCLKIELLQANESNIVRSLDDLEAVSNQILEGRDLEKIKEIYGTIDERRVNDLIQMRGL